MIAYRGAMSVTLDLPDEAWARLTAEANRRGLTVDALVAALADELPSDAVEAFVGCGESGIEAPFDLAAERNRLAARKNKSM